MKLLSFLIAAAAVLALFGSCTRRDDTDPPEPYGRSGLILLADARTGCQYLAVPLGGITPRRDGEGKHMGCR